MESNYTKQTKTARGINKLKSFSLHQQCPCCYCWSDLWEVESRERSPSVTEHMTLKEVRRQKSLLLFSFALWPLALPLCHTFLLGSTEHSVGKAVGPQHLSPLHSSWSIRKCSGAGAHTWQEYKSSGTPTELHGPWTLLSLSSSKTRDSFIVFALKWKKKILSKQQVCWERTLVSSL